ncbi:MAG: hypothetical protein ABWY48_11455 [Pseudoxanthomonas sp.]
MPAVAHIRTRFSLGLLFLLPVTAIAQVTATSEYLARMDVDGDGRVGRIEYLDWMSYAFDARDGNRDGVLTADELPGGKGQAITRVEHRERLSARFDKQDVNHDGYLSARELAAPPQ